jgi:hypothetical protein
VKDDSRTKWLFAALQPSWIDPPLFKRRSAANVIGGCRDGATVLRPQLRVNSNVKHHNSSNHLQKVPPILAKLDWRNSLLWSQWVNVSFRGFVVSSRFQSFTLINMLFHYQHISNPLLTSLMDYCPEYIHVGNRLLLVLPYSYSFPQRDLILLFDI